MAYTKLSPPWIIYYKEILALFGEDPSIQIYYDSEDQVITLYVNNACKAYALDKLLPLKKEFGNVVLYIKVIPVNKVMDTSEGLFEAAFKDNPVLSYIKEVHGLFDITYVVFINKVVQYFNDDLGDVNGLCSTLYQNIAEDIFGKRNGIFFCTDIKNVDGTSLGKPLGEWP